MSALHDGWIAALAGDVARLAGHVDSGGTRCVPDTRALGRALAARWGAADELAAHTCTDDTVVALFAATLDLADGLHRPALPAA